jgi:hypothetical protein
MQRIVRGRSATLTKDFTFTPTGTPTVVLTRVSDGTAITAGAVAPTADPSVFQYTIPSSSNTLLDTYVETWTAVSGGANQTFTDYIEVAGDVLFTVAELLARKPQNFTWTDAEMVAMRTTVENELEDACSQAFVPRYYPDAEAVDNDEALDGDGSNVLLLKWPHIRVIRSVTVDGVAYTAGQLAGLAFSPAGIVTNTLSTWPRGASNIVIRYEHGRSVAPPGGKQNALRLAKMWLVGQRSPIDDRATTFNTTEGGTYSLAVPGRNGSTFGLPDVDAWVQRNDLTVGVA